MSIFNRKGGVGRRRKCCCHDLRLDTSERDVHSFDGSQALVQGADFVGDGKVDGGFHRGDGSTRALVEGRSGHGWGIGLTKE